MRSDAGVPVGGARALVNHPRLYQQPVPPRFITSFYCEADYKIPIATASITNGAVKLNSPWLPFRPGAASAFASANFLGPASETTLLPTGWSTLCSNNLYAAGKCIRSTIWVRINPTTGSGATSCVVFPQFNTLSVSSIYQARTLPYTKQCVFNSIKNNVGTGPGGWLRHSISPAAYIGYSPIEAKADIQANVFQYNADCPLSLWWGVWFQTVDLDVTATVNSLLQVRVKYDVELYAPDSMPVT